MTTIEEIKKFLDEEKIKYIKGTGDFFYVNFQDIGTYKNNDQKIVKTFVGLSENGNYFQVVAPYLYDLENCQYKAEIFQVLNIICSNFKFIRWNVIANNAISLLIDMPLDDAKLSKMQLKRCIGTILDVIELYNDNILHTIKTGKINIKSE